MPEDVELHRGCLLAVVANDGDLHVEFSWHRRLCHLPVHLCPQILVLIERHIAYRTPQRLKARERHLELAQAVLVYGVPALQDCNLHGRLEKVLHTDWAILMHGVFHAGVRVPDLVWVAAATGVAVEIVFPSPNATDPALGAVEDLLLDTIVVPEVALLTEVSAEDLPASAA